jgi:Ca-activated chloride channel homolog
MELLGLSLAQFLGVLGAASALTVALYLLRLRRRRVAVPFIALWESLLAERQSSRLFSSLRHLLSLLLALAIVALLSLALADPRPRATASFARNVVILIDAGVTMQASDVTPSRLAVAVDKARELVRGAGAGLHVLIAQMDASTTPLSPLTGERHVLEQALDQLSARDLPTDHQRAYRFALDVLSGRDDAELVVISDAAVPPNAALAAALEREQIAVSHFPVGRRSDDVGISAFAIRRYPLDKNRSELLLELYSASEHAEDVELTLLGDGAAIDVQRMRLAPGKTLRRVYDDITGVARTLEARLSVTGDHDDLAANDRAYATLPERRRSRVLCVSDGNLYLQAALLLDEYLDVDVVAPGAYASAAGYDAVIFDRVAPAQAPAVPALYIAPAGEDAGPLAITGVIERPLFDELQQKHPVLRFTALGDVNVSRAALVEPARGDVVVAGDRRGPLIIAGERAGQRFVALTFDVRESDLPLRAAWPLLVLNTLDWFTASEEAYESSSVVGRPLTVELPEAVQTARLRDPDGRERALPASSGKVVLTPSRAGLYRLTSAGGERLLAVNLAERTRRDLAPQPQLLLGATAAPRPTAASPGLAQPPWALLAAAALLLLCAEWLTYHRRWTV